MKTNKNVNANVNMVTEDIQNVNPTVTSSNVNANANNVTVYADDAIETVTVAPSNPMLVPGGMIPQERGFKAFLKRHRGKFAAVGFLVASNAASYMYGVSNGKKSVPTLVTVPESQYILEPVPSSDPICITENTPGLEPIDISKEEKQ